MLTITADELPRFMACNGSLLMAGETLPPSTDDTTTRDEGIAAHWCAQQVFNRLASCEELVNRKAPNGVFITEEMIEHVSEYLDYLEDIGMPGIDHGSVECDTIHDHAPLWQVRGRCDYRVLTINNRLYIVDFKYGYRLVEPDWNWTLISHAIAIVKSMAVPPTHIHLVIHQPRGYHRDGITREWVIGGVELVGLYSQLDMALSAPLNQLNTGNHCGKCPAITFCPAATQASMTAIDYSSEVMADNLTNEQLAHHLNLMMRAEKIIKDRLQALEELGLHRVRSSHVIPGFGAKQGLSNARFKEGLTADLVKAMTGIDVSKNSLATPAEAKRRGLSDEMYEVLIERVPTKVKLVKVDANKEAARLFGKKDK